MPREINRREPPVNTNTPGPQPPAPLDAALEPQAEAGLTASPAETGNYLQRALAHVQHTAAGLTPGRPAEFAPAGDVQTTSSGGRVVHLEQRYKGIPIFLAAQSVAFAPPQLDGTSALLQAVGNAIPVPDNLVVAPKVSVEAAVRRAAEYVATPDTGEKVDQFNQALPTPTLDLTDFAPTITAIFKNDPKRPTVLEAGPFGAATPAHLIWFPEADKGFRLGWHILLTLPDGAAQYRVIIDADNGEPLYCRAILHQLTGRGSIFARDPRQAAQILDLPLPLPSYQFPVPPDLPAGFPDAWFDAANTAGNTVLARLGDNGVPVNGVLQNGVVTFNAANPQGNEQLVLHMFYHNCFMHDFFYLLGFREEDGNFQRDNFGRGGVGSDRVDARAYPGAVWGTASMWTPVDSVSPIMRMGLVTRTNFHTAFDASVVYHEYTHGVTNRLVGGPLNDYALEEPQSAGMGEGFSDYFACTVLNTQVVGDWVINDPRGIRAFPYTSNFPDRFDRLGQGRYAPGPDGDIPVHAIGEIWCATLLEMNRVIGRTLGAQLVVDALKLAPANPSFLDMRDAILQALDNKFSAGQLTADEYATAKLGLLTTFGKFGMGPAARSNGARLTGIIADFTVPQPPAREPQPGAVVVRSTPNLAIPDNTPSGVTATLNVQAAGQVCAIKVSVAITHPFISDLRVALVTPGGVQALLHDRGGWNQANLARTYDLVTTPALGRLLGQSAQGAWTLRVADLARRDVGQLTQWTLELTTDGA